MTVSRLPNPQEITSEIFCIFKYALVRDVENNYFKTYALMLLAKEF